MINLYVCLTYMQSNIKVKTVFVISDTMYIWPIIVETDVVIVQAKKNNKMKINIVELFVLQLFS